jgi:competence protein ComEC
MSRKNPLFKASLSYLAGLTYATHVCPNTDLLIVVASTAIIASIIIVYLQYWTGSQYKDKLNKKIIEAIFILSFFLLAQLNLSLSGYYHKITKISSIPSGKIKHTQLIIEKVIKSDDKSTIVNVTFSKFNEKVRLRINKHISNIDTGDTLYGTFYFYPIISDSSNIAFVKYMALNQIYSFGYAYTGLFNLKKSNIRRDKNFLNKIKNNYVNTIKSNIQNNEHASLIIALTTGYKGEMEKETARAFSKSGSMHLMAVSGLHVGYIHIFLTSLLFIFGNTKWVRRVRGAVILFVIWFYALFTGFTPSIIRASIMISCLEISKLTGRNNKSLNSLAFAFMIICVLNPESFFNAGFRLSFIATLSIILIHPKLYNLVSFNGRFEKYIWSSTSLSVSCQLGALPLTVAYFGYMPVYFMISNLLAIPLSALIIISSTTVTCLSGTSMSDVIIPFLEFLCRLLLWVVKTIESLPYATIEFR